MPGLVPGIHVLTVLRRKDVDGRDSPAMTGEIIFIRVKIDLKAAFRLLTSAPCSATLPHGITGENPMRRLWTVLAALATLSLTNCGYYAIQSNDEQVKSNWSD